MLLQIGVESVRNKARGSFISRSSDMGPGSSWRGAGPSLQVFFLVYPLGATDLDPGPSILYLIVIWCLWRYPLDRSVQGDGREQGARWCQPRCASKSGGCLFSHKADTPCNSHLVLRSWSAGTPQSDTDLGLAFGVIGLSRWTPWTILPLWLQQMGFSLAADIHVFLLQLFFLEQTYVLWPMQGKSHSSFHSGLFLSWNNSLVYQGPSKIQFPCPGLVLWISSEDPKARKPLVFLKDRLPPSLTSVALYLIGCFSHCQKVSYGSGFRVPTGQGGKYL